ncbi:Transposon Tf2-1 polyprotein [Ceratobasidium sp. AG-Ba]|nr:Transposon Tf2-1 polyprotein [Ceratobasidium sp. AG-Ba]
MVATPPSPAYMHAHSMLGRSIPPLPAPSLIISALSLSYGHFFVPVSLVLPDRASILTHAFLDSGATLSHISSIFVSSLSLPTTRLKNPQLIHTIDDRLLLSGALTHEVRTSLSIADSHFESISLGVVAMPYPVLLGLDWLKSHNPSIDWVLGSLTLSCCSIPDSSPLVVRSLSVDDVSRYSIQSAHTLDSDPGRCLSPTPAHLPTLSDSVLASDSVESASPSLAETASPTVVSMADSGRCLDDASLAADHRSTNICTVGAARFFKYARRAGAICGRIHPTSSVVISAATASSAAPSVSDRLAEIRESLPEPYWDYSSVFDPVEVDTLPPHRPYDMRIELEDGKTPPFGPIYGLSQDERAALVDYIDKNLAKGFIQCSTSSAASPILFVNRKSGELRLCVDYRGLNAITKKNRYPLPLVSDLLDRVNGCTIFSKIDLKNAFNLIRIAEGDEWKTAFRTNLGLFEYRVMPFGLTNAPSTFQAFIMDCLCDLLDVVCVVYLDDILVFSRSESDHIRDVRSVLERLRANNLFANALKCEFHRAEVEYLGFLIGISGISMHPSKLDTIRSWPVPLSVKDVQSFLGFTNFYRRFIARYASISNPLHLLTRKSASPGPRAPFIFGSDALAAFKELKAAFQSEPVLRHFDPSLPLTLLTDASDFAISGIHCQPDPLGALHPVAFYSGKFTPAEINYEIYDKEMLAVVDSLRHMCAWLLGSPFPISVVTDHRNLEYFMTSRVLNRRQARWSLFLADFDFTLSYAPGSKNPANAPSRRPDYIPREGDPTLTGQEQVLLTSDRLRDLHLPSIARIHALLSPPIHSLVDSLIISATFTIDAPDFLTRLREAAPLDAGYLAALESGRSDDFSTVGDTLLHKGKIFVPASLRVEVLRSRHDAVLAGHPGHAVTLNLVLRDFSWPNVRRFVRRYVSSCDIYARVLRLTGIVRTASCDLLMSLLALGFLFLWILLLNYLCLMAATLSGLWSIDSLKWLILYLAWKLSALLI